jgi:hypothetical protein
MSRTRARVLLALFVLLWVGYPIVFYGWYFTADRVLATVTGCESKGLSCPGHGTWTMADGTRGSGEIIGSASTMDVGTRFRVRATRSVALVDGPFSSWPAVLASGGLIVDTAAVVAIVALRRRYRRISQAE